MGCAMRLRHRRREAGCRAAMNVVADDADVVGRRSPGQVDRASGDGGLEPRRRRRRVRVRGHRRCSLVRGRPDVAGGVLGGDLVEVAAGRGRVDVAGARRLCDPVSNRRREAGARAAVDVVANDADVVGRGTPRQRRAPDRTDGTQRARCARRQSVAHGRACLVRRAADVAGRVLGGDLVVVGAGGDAVGVGGAGRLCDPVAGGGREAGGRAPVDVVADDSDVVARGAPTQLRGGERPVRGQCSGGGRRRRIRVGHRAVHVALDLGGGQARGCRREPRRCRPGTTRPTRCCRRREARPCWV